MKKQEFLDELQHYLRVLQDEEQEDILLEYKQHIEMKIEHGQSEEEVIRDFGSIRELAGEILEAYHVKLKDEEPTAKFAEKEQKQFRANQVIPTIFSVKLHAARSGRTLAKAMFGFGVFLGKPFRLLGKTLKRWKETVQKKLVMQTEKKEKKRVKKGMIFPLAVKMVRKIYHGIVNGLYWAGRMIWNCGVVCAAAFSVFMGLIFLYLFGALIILWSQGYPLGGVVIGSFGAVLCFMSLAVFGSTFYRGKRCCFEHRRKPVLHWQGRVHPQGTPSQKKKMNEQQVQEDKDIGESTRE